MHTTLHLTLHRLHQIKGGNKETPVTPTLEKLSRVDDAYGRLKEEIRSNRMPPEYRAPETEVAMQLGMSRTPVREALIRLEAEGMVELIPRRGMRVLPVRIQDMREIYDVLTAVEPEAAAALAARKPSAQALAPLIETMGAMERALAAGDLNAWAQADDGFHHTLLALNGNRRLEAIAGTLYDQAHRVRMFTLHLRDLPTQSTQEHRLILDHLRAGNAEGARRAFRQHRERTVSELLSLLDKHPLTQF